MLLIHRPKRLLVGCMLVALGISVVPGASASCRRNVSSGFSSQSIDMNLGEVNVPSDLAVGGVILTRSFPVAARSSTSFFCDFSGGYSVLAIYQSDLAQGVPGFGPNVLSTAVPGIGLRIRQTVTAGGGGTSTLYYRAEVNYKALQSFGVPSSSIVVELIKTNVVVGSGPIARPGLLVGQYVDFEGSSPPIVGLYLREGGAIIRPPTCTPSAGSRNIPVNFGAVSRSVFSGVGSTAASRDFNIELDCQDSSVAGSTVGVRVDAQQDLSNLPGVLPLTVSADAASGIAIQMVRRGTQGEQPLRFGENIVLASGAMNAGMLVLPLSARYIQTKAGVVGAGRAGGVATFTIQYN